ncbi:ATP-binding Cassette (ABC) Superfamily [Phytophthora infestans T30-4]|uniref:ATP-binding Cassette (ABC) Superfamily n=1 Tax=Phytophthora infestans (strain T30-4) TaxID=403677 RepID=D0MVB4_PHYIT|nr:ATP-binding Cassette (ABC) Superfamily [Phytophthora infestans T30-4]EEY61110.1 ATP-binding Cassette (ABC) Superfamily [Phytophthora infestans T30-4]|eukprot:XP_002908027.1 ATP-binding Cassette (ABC) Superfamily [Phytophthora infestans T30-4]
MTLAEKDIWELDLENQTRTALTKLTRQYENSGGLLLRAVLRCYGLELAMCGLASIASAACELAAPVVLHHVLEAFTAPQTDLHDLCIWLGLFFASRLLNALLSAHLEYYVQIIGLRATSAIRAFLFLKSLRSSSSSSSSVEIMNLFTSDMGNITIMIQYINSTWVLPLQIGAIVYMLYWVIGLAAFAGLALIVLCSLLGMIVGKMAADPTQEEGVAIDVQNGTLGWNTDTTVLNDVNFQIKRGDLAVVHGAVGSGTSSLCYALLGEMQRIDGRVFVRGKVAYYSQQPWIQNLSIRDNILFGHEFDEAKYGKVLEACGLVADMKHFPSGDLTEIGEKGVNLSGGQKARVSLARACYADADVYKLDSPLAAVDAAVRNEIFGKCICGLLGDKTVLLVTHSRDVIRSPAVNYIVRVEDGTVHGERLANQIHRMDEERQQGRVTSDVFWIYFKALGGAKMCVLVVVSQLLWQAFQIGSDFWLSHWTSEASVADNETNMEVYALLGGGGVLMVLLRSVCVVFAGLRGARYLFGAMTDALMHAPMKFFDTNPIGRIVNRYTTDIGSIDFQLPLISASNRSLRGELSRHSGGPAGLDTVSEMWYIVRIQLIGCAVVIGIVSALVYLRDLLPPGFIGLAFTYALNVDAGLANIARQWSFVELIMVSPERVMEYASIAPEGSNMLVEIEPAIDWPLRGVITFQNVNFSYERGDLILKNVSFTIGNNEKVGIVGRTGAGKSSLSMALFRINELVSGQICIDGIDISTISVRKLRAGMSIIPQVPVLFNEPLRDYLDPFDQLTDEAIWVAIDKVGMKSKIRNIENQLEFELGENAGTFSVGERQLLCLARAVLKCSRIVVMDEATSSIDHDTEQNLQKMLRQNLQDTTTESWYSAKALS